MSISPDRISLSEEQKQQLARLAEQTGKPWEKVLAEAIESYRSTSSTAGSGEESFYDAAIRSGLIGCLDGGPPDLSTNPKYMEGFGEHGI